MSGNINLYAVWTSSTTYTVTYNGNGFTSGSVPVDTTGYITGQTITALANTGGLVKTGFAFSGWNTQAGGGGISYFPGATFAMASANINFYAVWSVTYTVTYNANGASSGSVPTDPNKYTNGQSVAIPGNTGNLSLSGYAFNGWDTQSGGQGPAYAGGQSFVMGPSNQTFFAVWTEYLTEYQTYSNAPGYSSGVYCGNTYSTLFWTNAANGSYPVLSVNPSTTFQTMTGIGGAFTMSGGYVLSLCPQNEQKMIINMLFGTNGNDYTFCRTHMGSCDYSLYSYGYDNDSNDTSLSEFTVATDDLYLVPFITDALAAQAETGEPNNIFLYACPWLPCVWMTTRDVYDVSSSVYPNNYLISNDYQLYANYMVKYVQAYAARGITVSMLGLQNEPDGLWGFECMDFDLSPEAGFIASNLGPTLVSNGLSTKIMVADTTFGFNAMKPYVAGEYNEPGNITLPYIYGSAEHWYQYQGDAAEDGDTTFEKCHNDYPANNIFMTQACSLNIGPHIGDWGLAEAYAHDMIHDLNQWIVGWSDWNMILDTSGGPNHAGNFNGAFIEVNTNTLSVITNPGYYYMRHFSKYIRPGSQVISVTNMSAWTHKLYVCGVLNVNNNIDVEVLNWNNYDQSFNLQYGTKYLPVTAPAHTLTTFTFQK